MTDETHDDTQPGPKPKLHLSAGSLADVSSPTQFPRNRTSISGFDNLAMAVAEEVEKTIRPMIDRAVDFHKDGRKVDFKHDNLGGADRSHIDDAERAKILETNTELLMERLKLTPEDLQKRTPGDAKQLLAIATLEYNQRELENRIERINSSANPTTNRTFHMARPAETWIKHAIKDIAGNADKAHTDGVAEVLNNFVYDVTQKQRDDHRASESEVYGAAKGEKSLFAETLDKLKNLGIPQDKLDKVLHRAEEVMPFIVDEANYAVSQPLSNDAFNKGSLAYENAQPKTTGKKKSL